MEKRFEFSICIEDNEKGDETFYRQLTREEAKVVAMALSLRFEYNPETDGVDMFEGSVFDEDEDFSERVKEDHLLIGCVREEEIVCNEEYRFKLNAQIEEKRYDNYYEIDEEGEKIYHSSLEGYREELDQITAAIDELP